MKTKILILALLSVVTVVATAQTYTRPVENRQAIQSQQIMKTGVSSGVVYEPFSGELPSESSSPARVSGPRKNNYNDLFDQGADSGQSDQSPVGDAVLPLLLMAFAFGGAIYLRRRQRVE